MVAPQQWYDGWKKRILNLTFRLIFEFTHNKNTDHFKHTLNKKKMVRWRRRRRRRRRRREHTIFFSVCDVGKSVPNFWCRRNCRDFDVANTGNRHSPRQTMSGRKSSDSFDSTFIASGDGWFGIFSNLLSRIYGFCQIIIKMATLCHTQRRRSSFSVFSINILLVCICMHIRWWWWDVSIGVKRRRPVAANERTKVTRFDGGGCVRFADVKGRIYFLIYNFLQLFL